MKSSTLISRMVRVIETEGAVGEGASLSEEYSLAVQQANSRLDAVQMAIDAKQVSDAVRIMEDMPKLLDEVSTLDFPQLPDWEVLCSRNQWTLPQKLDKTVLERVLVLNESTEVVEPYLRMYRKAVRTNNNMLAVQSLRRLVQIDHSQNWKVNLLQAEEVAQRQLVDDFRVAKASGKAEETDRLAQEFVDANWTELPMTKGVGEIRAYLAEREATRRKIEGGEDLSVIRRCMSGNWNLSLAFSMLQAIDGLIEKGFLLPDSDRNLVDSCRRRCADEMESAKKERRWKELCERLHEAIEQENTIAIRDVRSAPEFLDREPPPELIQKADLVIKHEDESRKRKTRLIGVLALVGLLAVLSLSGWWLHKKLYNHRCEGEAIKLATLEKGEHAVDRLSEALQRLKRNAPEVYTDPRVNVYEGKLESMRSAMISRTNEIASVLTELNGLKEANWGDSIEAITNRIERVKAIIAKDDGALRTDFLALQAAWAEHCEKMENINRTTATSFHETLVSHIQIVASRLRSELSSDALTKEVASCKASIDEWRRVYAQHVPNLEGRVDEAEKTLVEAENTQCNLQELLKKINSATTAQDFLSARKALVDFYSEYPFVKDIGNHPVNALDAVAIVEGSSPEQKAYLAMLKSGVDDATFKDFIHDKVLSLEEVSSYYSLYGIAYRGNPLYFAMCKGKPRISMPNNDQNYQIDGEMLDFSKGEIIHQKTANGKPLVKSLPPSDEIKNVVDIAKRSTLSLPQFEQEIIQMIATHLKVAADKDFLRNEIEVYGNQIGFSIDRYPSIRRVQLIHLYFVWLMKDLKIMPHDGSFSRWFDRLEKLSQDVSIDQIPDDLTWTCLHESRVRQRNSECAKLLWTMAQAKFVDEYRAMKKARMELRKISNWKIEYAGFNKFDPFDKRWMKDHSVVLPSTLGSVKKDHPLYVLRRENNRLVLKRALVPNENATNWKIESGMINGFVSGDPLFQVSADGHYIDAEEAVHDILMNIPETMRRQYSTRIPLFEIEAK